VRTHFGRNGIDLGSIAEQELHNLDRVSLRRDVERRVAGFVNAVHIRGGLGIPEEAAQSEPRPFVRSGASEVGYSHCNSVQQSRAWGSEDCREQVTGCLGLNAK